MEVLVYVYVQPEFVSILPPKMKLAQTGLYHPFLSVFCVRTCIVFE